MTPYDGVELHLARKEIDRLKAQIAQLQSMLVKQDEVFERKGRIVESQTIHSTLAISDQEYMIYGTSDSWRRNVQARVEDGLWKEACKWVHTFENPVFNLQRQYTASMGVWRVRRDNGLTTV
jgi:hypothetical protein